ncbi:hypothetical protein PIB30_035812 [Stylosanthes scabra]|uniref:Uncharacterized protein n=1 Tax=Stylosanthes scabra TaxID=79078 RepID=A0ABU6XBB2_9FABA|nr:hypothetical protein [Stylosanthes scabra]
MPRRPRYPKKTNLITSGQQPQEEAPEASFTQWDVPLIPSTGGGVPATSCRPFRPPQSETGPSPQTNADGNQNQMTEEEEVNPFANDVDSFDDQVNRSVEASDAGNGRGRRNAKPWTVDVISNKLIFKALNDYGFGLLVFHAH